jgi:hypothetical protein
MPKSFARGDYSLLLAIESSSRPDSWYRVLADRQTGALSCDCPPWIFNQNEDAQGRRFCPHTRITERLSQVEADGARIATPVGTVHQLIQATQEQWPGLRGTWSIEERDALITPKPYHFVLLRLALGNGGTATGTVAFARRHRPSAARLEARVAGWAGYAIAAEVARLGGYPMAGQPPEHFRVERRQGSGRQRQRPTPGMPPLGLADILRVGDVVDLGDGRSPAQRAENTLRLFLGEQLYGQLEQQGFLDVPSAHYTHEQRVYRLRRDAAHARERRVRVFERGRYSKDFCIVRAQDVPEADHVLTVFLGLLSDELSTLSVVQSSNIFSPNSDGPECETVPAVWQPRATPVVAYQR